MSIYFVQYLNNKHSKYNRYKVKTTGCHTHNSILQKLLYLRNSAYSHIYSKERRINALCTSGAICHAEFSTLSFEKYIKRRNSRNLFLNVFKLRVYLILPCYIFAHSLRGLWYFWKNECVNYVFSVLKLNRRINYQYLRYWWTK